MYRSPLVEDSEKQKQGQPAHRSAYDEPRRRDPETTEDIGNDLKNLTLDKKVSKTSLSKAMLSEALQKANTAVLLDNAKKFQGAQAAYRDASDLLHQVLLRTAGADDRKKLEAIVSFYR